MATGTGSGKTEAFLVPVVAHAFEQRHRPGVKAIALYPMNALVNDQEDRVRTACEALGLRYGVYTGATPAHERARMQENPPDILLTNYSMLEFILTRREDRKLFGAGVLRHLVLDEIHTYQGALGSEIACLVRRLRGHVDVNGLVCVGLSATVSAGGDHDADVRRTAAFASDLFAVPFGADAIVEESPVEAPVPDPASIGPAPDPVALRAALAAGGETGPLRAVLGDPQASPMLDLLRAELSRPRTVEELVGVLAALPQRAGADPGQLRDEVAGWLLLGAGTHTAAGPPVLEAKVHVFLRSLPHLVRCAGRGRSPAPRRRDGLPARRVRSAGNVPARGVPGLRPGLRPRTRRPRQDRYRTTSPAACMPTRWRPRTRGAATGTRPPLRPLRHRAGESTCLGCGGPAREVTVAEPEASSRR